MNNKTAIELADLKDIQQISIDTAIDPVALERWLEMIESNKLVLIVARNNAKYIGRVNLWLTQADEPEINEYFPGVPLINALQINKLEQGKGMGTKILEYAHEYLKQNGYKQIGLGVEPDNMKAVNLYKKLGFIQQKIGNKDAYVSSWDETKPNGSIQKYSVVTNFYLKEL